MTIAQALAEAARDGVARLDAQLLLLHALGRPPQDRAWLLAHDTDPLVLHARTAFAQLCQRRLAGEPVAYLVGHKEFFGLDLLVDRRVLVPRPETELLVEWALEVLAPMAAPRVADLGTGSGAIALALQQARPDARVTAIDASEDALQVARANAAHLGLAVDVVPGHWLQGVSQHFQLLVSNPPYVADGDPHLAALGHEPRQALVAGADGLDDLREIVAAAPARLVAGGSLLLEHGWDQAVAVRALLVDAGFTDVSTRRDLAGVERCSGGRRLEHG